jgi:small subunit ribosomal protein S4
MVSRSRPRRPHVSGSHLSATCAWYLRRRRRTARRRRGVSAVVPPRLPDDQRHKVRAEYQLRDRQLGRVLSEATRQPGDAGEHLVELLEQRVDVVVWRAGFAPTLRQARKLVEHNHFTLDGTIVDRPSQRVRPGQTVQVRDDRRGRPLFAAAGSRDGQPPYLDVRRAELRATLTREPRKQEVPVLRGEPLVVAAPAPGPPP